MNKKLFQRINDIYTGAIGHEYKEDEDFLGAEDLANVITALCSVFNPKEVAMSRFTRWNIKEFENPTRATEYIENLLEWKVFDGSTQD